eukprot:11187284-Lingulodinium_polyedra.AAC.1
MVEFSHLRPAGPDLTRLEGPPQRSVRSDSAGTWQLCARRCSGAMAEMLDDRLSTGDRPEDCDFPRHIGHPKHF